MQVVDQLEIENFNKLIVTLKIYLSQCADWLESSAYIIRNDNLSYDVDDDERCIEFIKKARELCKTYQNK